MPPVFVDTGAWLAVAVTRDQYHREATAYYQQISQRRIPLLTTNYVLAETYTRIRYDDGHAKALRFHEIILTAIGLGRLRLAWITPEIHEASWSLFRDFPDQEFSFIDCTSFVVAKHARVEEVFGFDRGFTIMGLTLKPLLR